MRKTKRTARKSGGDRLSLQAEIVFAPRSLLIGRGFFNLSVVDIGETLPPELERFWSTDDGLTAVQRAEAYGIDISLLEANLRLSPTERLRQNDLILNESEALRAAYLSTREGTY